MSYVGTKVEVSSNNTSPVTLSLRQPTSNYTVTAIPVATGAVETYAAATSGTITLTAKVSGLSTAEPVYQSDGTTAVTFDCTASAPASVSLENIAIDQFIATPASLPSGSAVRLIVSYE